MTEHPKIKPSHLARTAVIYVRQSTLAQVERNTESTRRQYDLTGRAAGLGWPHSAIRLIDADQGVSGSVTGRRDGFEDLVAEVALDLVGVCDTLVADTDTVYHPALFDDRLLLGLKGTMSEALCRCRHKASYADLVVMPTWGREPLVVTAPGRMWSA